MRVTIIPVDSFVSVDNRGYSGLDLSFMESDIHALQWYETEGELEIQDSRGRVIENRSINSLEPYQPALDAWQAAKDAAEAEALQIKQRIIDLNNNDLLE